MAPSAADIQFIIRKSFSRPYFCTVKSYEVVGENINIFLDYCVATEPIPCTLSGRLMDLLR